MSRRFLILVGAAVAAGMFGWLAVSQWLESGESDLSNLPVVPAGRWHILPTGTGVEAISEDEDDRARLMSLPYLSGRQEAGAQSGVVAHDPALTAEGVNLYVSGHGPEALLVGMDGRLLHRWRLPFEEAFEKAQAGVDTSYWRRAHLLPDGSLLAIFQAGGMVKVDRDSRLLWAIDEGFYNDIEVTGEGGILAIKKAARIISEINPEEYVLEDSVVRVSPDGVVLGRLSLLRAFLDSPFRDLLDPIADVGDILHTNTVEWLDGRHVERSGIFRRGNLLVSFREVDIVAIIDPVREVVVWAARGPWDAQHEPTMLADGNLLIFDNLGAGGFSRVLEFDPLAMEVGWQFPDPDDESLSSPEAGTCQRLDGGTTLITESERGRAIEVTRDGEIVWEFLSPHRAGEGGRLVATLFDVVRLPFEAARFLDG